MTDGLGLRLSDEHVDLDQLAIQPGDVGAEHGGKLGRGRGRRIGRRGHRVTSSPVGASPQSSGIRIQPWRIAYTTAWVRSLTDSFRRIELMWFLTVCSEIDSA